MTPDWRQILSSEYPVERIVAALGFINHWRVTVEQKDSLDHAALLAAKQHMGGFAWPTVVLGLVVVISYLGTLVLAVIGIMPLIMAAPLIALLTYAAYTVLHEAAHGTISGSQGSMRWLNETMGYLAAWILMIPLTAHRHEHLAHHRHTNERDGDPDFIVSNMAESPACAVMALLEVFTGQYRYYFTHRWSKSPTSQNLYLCLEVVAALVPRLALFGLGYWVEGLVLLGAAWLAGIGLVLFLFAYVVHTPHESVGRYVDTSTILVEGFMGKIVTWLWLCQNYHSIHHLFPRVPFYRYPSVFREIEETMVTRGAPIYRFGLPGLELRRAPAG